jgi:hypothetical protein
MHVLTGFGLNTAFIPFKRQFAPQPGITLDFDFFYRLGGRLLLWFCDAILNAGRLGWQERCGRVVKAAVHFSRHPLWLAEMGAKYVEVRFHQGFALGSTHEIDALRWDFKEVLQKRGEAYDENFYRRPIGIGVLLALVFSLFLI